MHYGVQWLDASLIGLLGLLIGSFLNVVVHRMPKMMERQWQLEAAEMAGADDADAQRGGHGQGSGSMGGVA